MKPVSWFLEESKALFRVGDVAVCGLLLTLVCLLSLFRWTTGWQVAPWLSLGGKSGAFFRGLLGLVVHRLFGHAYLTNVKEKLQSFQPIQNIRNRISDYYWICDWYAIFYAFFCLFWTIYTWKLVSDQMSTFVPRWQEDHVGMCPGVCTWVDVFNIVVLKQNVVQQ